MREILFRAKRIDNGEWVEGDLSYLIHNKEKMHVFPADGLDSADRYEVNPETLCQYTGLKDKNGNRIWENDICRYYNPEDKDGIGIIKEDYVSWIKGAIAQTNLMTPMFYLKVGKEFEVIGNIFDNPELLGQDGE